MQMRPFSLPTQLDPLDPKQLEKYIRHLVKAMLEQTNMHMDDEQLNKFVKEITSAINQGMKNQDGTVDVARLQDPNFIKQLVIACVFNKIQESLNNNPEIQKLRSKLDPSSPLLNLSLSELAVIAEIIKENMKLVQDMKDAFIIRTPTPTPTPAPKPEEDKKKKEEEEEELIAILKEAIERYVYLFAMNPAVAGSNPFIVTMSKGNQQGFVDQSYGVGNDVISEATKLLDADGTLNTKVLAGAIAAGQITVAESIVNAATSSFTNPTPTPTPD